MIKKLLIQHYALIEQLEMDFRKGFSVITGETGAGKSIMLGALSLILGQRADAKAVREGASRCLIEGTFDVSAYDLQSFFDENELEYDAAHCILRREVYATGKSRAFINDTPVSLVQLKELGSRLIDIHSQHQNLLLGDSRFQLDVLDVLANDDLLLKQYKEAYSLYKTQRHDLDEMKKQTGRNKEEEDFVRFQLEQLREADLKPNEKEELEQEQELLTHAEEIKGNLCLISQCIQNDESGILPLLKEAAAKAKNLIRIYPDIQGLTDRLESNYIDLKDISYESDSMQEKISVDAERTQVVQERLDLIYRLLQKHRLNKVDELLELQAGYQAKLSEIDHSEEDIVALEKQMKIQFEVVLKLGEQLSAQRKAAAPLFGERLEKMVRPLGMPNMHFMVEFTERNMPDEDGLEQVRFMFSANKNQTLQPIADVASGGEISRFMLCLKALIADAMALPTIIFDEVDTGVSGEIADKMGNIMRDMGHSMQVISITHLPQVAAKGGLHYKVYKKDDETGTKTSITRLSDEERCVEIAGMLSGSELTEAALDNARILLKN